MADQCCLDLCTGCDCGELCGNVCSILLCYQCFQNCGECNCHCGSSKRGRHGICGRSTKGAKTTANVKRCGTCVLEILFKY